MGNIRINEDLYKKIRKKSYEANVSVSWYVVQILQKEIENDERLLAKSEKVSLIKDLEKLKRKFLLNISDQLLDELKIKAKENYCSTNKYINIILNNSIFAEAKYTVKELEELHNSNYQLMAIGRNLNQITRKINAGISDNIEFAYLSELIDVINAHIDKVGKLLINND